MKAKENAIRDQKWEGGVLAELCCLSPLARLWLCTGHSDESSASSVCGKPPSLKTAEKHVDTSHAVKGSMNLSWGGGGWRSSSLALITMVTALLLDGPITQGSGEGFRDSSSLRGKAGSLWDRGGDLGK